MSIILIDTRWHLIDIDKTLCGLDFPSSRLIRSNSSNADCSKCQQAMLNLPVMPIKEIAVQKARDFLTDISEVCKRYKFTFELDYSHDGIQNINIVEYDTELENEFFSILGLTITGLHIVRLGE